MGAIMLDYVETIVSKGRVYHYYRRNKQRFKLPHDPSTPAFIEAYNSTHATFSTNSRIESVIAGSVGSLIALFKGSTDYSALKPQVRKMYLLSLDMLQEDLGRLPATGITRAVFLKWRDELANTPSKANNFIAIASRLWAFGIDRGLVTLNPAAKIKKLKIGEWRPWTVDEIETFNKSAPLEMKNALALALYTGQRLGDVIKMRWNQISDGGIEVIQQKTGEKVWIPIHGKLQAILSEMGRTSVMILTMASGLPFKADTLKHQFKASSRASGLPEDCVFHGLRKTAAVMLAEAGCSTEQIKAITGHRTDEMVAHYTKGAQQKVMAKAAIQRLEFGTP